MPSTLDSQVDSHAEKRLSCLTDLFNAIPDATVQYSVLLDTLSYAKKANLVGLLAPVVKVGQSELSTILLQLRKHVDLILLFFCLQEDEALYKLQASAEEWAKEWKLNVADQRTLFFACADILRLSKVSHCLLI